MLLVVIGQQSTAAIRRATTIGPHAGHEFRLQGSRIVAT
jgi:hypothetical protein